MDEGFDLLYEASQETEFADQVLNLKAQFKDLNERSIKGGMDINAIKLENPTFANDL